MSEWSIATFDCMNVPGETLIMSLFCSPCQFAITHAKAHSPEQSALSYCVAYGFNAYVCYVAALALTPVPPVTPAAAALTEFAGIAASMAVAMSLVVVSLFTPLFSSLVQRSAIGGLDQALGFFFGVARGILLVAVAFFVYETVITAQDIPAIDDSRSAAVFSRFTDRIEEQNPEAALGWITTQYEDLVSVCDAPADADA